MVGHTEGFGAVASGLPPQRVDCSVGQRDPVSAADGHRRVERQAAVVDGDEGVADEQRPGFEVGPVQAKRFAFAHAGVDKQFVQFGERVVDQAALA